jgi:predicted ArsR family transcriptional regulator
MGWWERHFGDTSRGRVVALLRRGRRSVEELAAQLGLTDNAVRAQLAALERDGVVASAGVRRAGTVGKPATLYEIAPGADVLFSSAYAPVLAALLAELGDRTAPGELERLLRDVGRRLARAVGSEAAPADTAERRARLALAVLGELGGDADLARADGAWVIRSHGCPLGQAVAVRPELCRAVEVMLSEVTRVPVHERCDRDGPPRCRFVIGADAR